MFGDDLKRGKRGENYVRDLMARRNHKVIDVSDNYDIGFDFFVDDMKCELKTDYVINQSGNLFLEEYMDYFKGGRTQGWFKTSKATHLLYLDEKSKTLYIYLLDSLRDYVKENIGYLTLRSLDDGYKTVFGYCVPIDAVPHQTIKRGA